MVEYPFKTISEGSCGTEYWSYDALTSQQ